MEQQLHRRPPSAGRRPGERPRAACITGSVPFHDVRRRRRGVGRATAPCRGGTRSSASSVAGHAARLDVEHPVRLCGGVAAAPARERGVAAEAVGDLPGISRAWPSRGRGPPRPRRCSSGDRRDCGVDEPGPSAREEPDPRLRLRGSPVWECRRRPRTPVCPGSEGADAPRSRRPPPQKHRERPRKAAIRPRIEARGIRCEGVARSRLVTTIPADRKPRRHRQLTTSGRLRVGMSSAAWMPRAWRRTASSVRRASLSFLVRRRPRGVG